MNEHDAIILEKWRAVRASALESARLLDEHPSQPDHDMPGLVAACDAAIAALLAKDSE